MGLNSILEALRVRTDFRTNAQRRLSVPALLAIVGLPLLLVSLIGFASTSHAADITTYHNNAQRTGWNATEQTLTARNVGSSEFRLLQSVPLDDQVDAQPLIVTQQTIKDRKHDVVYVATENDTIYAIDTLTGEVLLNAHFGTPVPMNELPGGCNNNANHVGINSTPVIDTADGTMYVIIYTFESNAPVFRIHALNLEDLTDKVPPVVITASQKLSDGTTYSFRPHNARQRSALLEANGNIYAGFASFCDIEANNSRGWLLGWQTGSLKPLAGNELSDKQSDAQTPPSGLNDFFLSSIWMSGYGVAADSSGDLYFVTGNSDTVRVNNIQETAVKISPDLTAVKDSFTPANFAALDQNDTDFGSGGLLVLPDQRGPLPHLAVAAGKDGRLFVLNRDDMGGFVSGGPDKPKNVAIGGCWCGPSYFVGSDGVGRVVSSGGTQLNTWKVDTSAPVALVHEGTSASLLNGIQDPGFFTTVSSNGTGANSAIIWAVSRPHDNGSPGGFKTQSDVFLADDGFMYFRGTDDTVWRVSTDGSVSSNPGGFKTQSNVFVANGFMYFRGTDDKVWRVSTDGTTVRSNPGGFTTHSDVRIGADGLMYFRGTDDKVWRVSTDGTTVRSNPGGFTTHSDVFPGADGLMYFRGTDDKVWRVSTDGTTVRSNPGGFTTHSDVLLGADGLMYFRGTDDKVWRVSTDGTTVRSNPGGFTTHSDVLLGADGLMYFRGTDDKVWRVSTDGTTVRSNPGGFTTQSDVVLGTDGCMYFRGTDDTVWRVRTDGSVCNTVSLYAFNVEASGGMMYFRGTDDTVWRVSTDGKASSNPGGFKTQSDVFLADDGFMYFRGTDDTVWRVSTDGSVSSNPGGFKTQSNVFVANGFMYFRGTDDKVWRVSTDGTTVRSNPGGFTTHSDVLLGADGLMYFRGTDDKVWRVSTDGTTVRSNPGGFTTHSDVFPGADGLMYFRGTDDKVWRVSTDGTTVRSNPGGFTTHSDVLLGADGLMYFRGTDDKVWRVSTDGTTVRSNPGGFTTHSDVLLGADGLMYFRGTDNKVWRVSTDGTTVRSNPGGFTTQSDVLFAAHGYLPELWHDVAGTWPNVGGNANIVPTVANGHVYVASFKQLAIFGLAPPGTRIRMATVERPLQAPVAPPLPEVSGSRFFGTIASIDGDHVVVRLRTGESLAIDLANARKAFQTVIPFIGETVAVSGTLEANGTLNAQTMLRAKGTASWGPDRR